MVIYLSTIWVAILLLPSGFMLLMKQKIESNRNTNKKHLWFFRTYMIPRFDEQKYVNWSKHTFTPTLLQMKYGSLLHYAAVWQNRNAKVIYVMPTCQGKQQMEGIISSGLQCILVVGYCDYHPVTRIFPHDTILTIGNLQCLNKL